MVQIFEIEEEPAPAPAPEAPKPVLYVATPAYGCMLNAVYLECMLRLQEECSRRGIACFIDILGNESLVQRARNLLTKRFLLSPATHLFFVDADIGFNPLSVMRMLDFDKDIVTGVYPKKYVNWDKVRERLQAQEPSDEPLMSAGLDYNINIAGPQAHAEQGFVRVLDSATGFMLLKRAAVEKLCEAYKDTLTCVNDIIGDAASIKDYVAIFDCMIDPDTHRYLSEDYSMCRRWQQLGGEVYVDIASPLCHVGGYMFKGDYKSRLEALKQS